jgi:hypothetical protein
MESYTPITGIYWNPGLSCRIQNSAVETPLELRIPNIHLTIGAPHSKIPTMSVLYTLRSSPDSKLETGEEQGASKWEPVLLSKILTLKKSQELKGRSEKFKKHVAVLSKGLD